MSEEAAFLETLKANPADDTARLVYADWLDEHGEPAKAEYLRLVATLAQAEQDYTREQPEVTRLLTLVETLPLDWGVEAGSRFKLLFYAIVNSAKKVGTIKAVRDVSGLGLANAVTMIEFPPSEVIPNGTFERTFLGREMIRNAGGTVYAHPCERTDRPIAIFYDIVAKRNPSGAKDSEDAFAKFLQTAMNIGAVEARRLARNDRVTIAKYQEPVSTGERVRALLKHIDWVPIDNDDPPDSAPAWGIWVYTVPSREAK